MRLLPKLALLSTLAAVLTIFAPHDGYAQKKKKERIPEKPILTVQSGEPSKSLQLQRIVNTIRLICPL